MDAKSQVQLLQLEIATDDGTQNIPKNIIDVDPDSLEGHQMHHKIEYALIKKIFERISLIEGHLYNFSFKLSKDGKTEIFSILESFTKELRIKKCITGPTRSVYPRVAGMLQPYLEALDKKPS